ncbi:MAG: hypothetical protein KKA84_05420 [Bacteroidetes bacterium]|nr:hypothetical protein [Bacteroidota bacterium]
MTVMPDPDPASKKGDIMKSKKNVFLLVLLSGFYLSVNSQSIDEFGKTWTKFNVNNISTFLLNDGQADFNGNFRGTAGFEYPKGNDEYCFYKTGLIWAGRFHYGISMGGSMFTTSLVQGRINDFGITVEPTKIYRVRPEANSQSNMYESKEINVSTQMVIDQYSYDKTNWPAEFGAPYRDVNLDGYYDSSIDIPGYPDADQTIWYVANGSDSTQAFTLFEVREDAVEMQVTIWGYKRGGYLANTIFKRYKIINKSDSTIKQLYLGIWADPDVGIAGDDFVGCDTLLQLGFAYNSDNEDGVYGSNSPSAGICILKGPSIDDRSNSKRSLYFPNHLGMQSFSYHVNENSNPFGLIDDYRISSLYYYNLLQGKIPSTGEYFPVPEEIGGGSTRYPLSGDPVSGLGYVDGIIKGPTDRRFTIGSGPVECEAGDTLEILVAQLAAGGTTGINNIEAVALLKENTKLVQVFAKNNFEFPKPYAINNFQGTSGDNGMVLKWSEESQYYPKDGYEFQGYNVFQLPYSAAPLEEGIKIKTFDKIDGVKVVLDENFECDQFVLRVAREGNDWGIENELEVEKDYLNNCKLHLGSEYYYAITNYNFSESPWAGQHSFESEPTYITVTVGENEGPDIKKINVFPNPYYGANPNELNKYQRYVTFTHLPEKATIRIFNLAGQLVKTIFKSEPGQFQRWDLMNEHNTLVPGGIYIAYIEMPELGETKILKLAIIPEKIIPDWY